MAALQRAIWDEISRIAESYKSEVQIAKAQEESIERRMSEVFQQSGYDCGNRRSACANSRPRQIPTATSTRPSCPALRNRSSSNPFLLPKPG